MNIIWFSEIRWDYLFTRKQHILSLFPKKDNILFHNKVQLTLDLFDNHNQKGDMKGYEFFCESRYSSEPKKPGQEI